MAELQRRGVLTVMVCSDAFLPLGKAQARMLHCPQLPFAVIEHPLGGISKQQVEQRSAQALPQIVEVLRSYG